MIKVYKEIGQVDILAFGIHPDDVELSASGTILSHIDKGYKVGVCDLTKGELGSRGTPRTRLSEAKDASDIMRIDWRVNLEMADGFSSIDKAHILKIAEVIRLAQPKIILANALDDRHPDHPRGAQLVREAFFFSGLKMITSIQGKPHRADTLYHYIQDKQLSPELCIDITKYVDTKMAAIRAYKTQFYQGENAEDNEGATPISSKAFTDFMIAKMKVFGRAINAEYAEGYILHREIGVDNLMDLR